MMKKYYVGLDFCRIIICLVVCAFHTTIHLGCNYGILQGVSVQGGVVMSAFFLLSGFSIYSNYESDNLSLIDNMKGFWLKRFLSIMPMYYIAAILFYVIRRPQALKYEIILSPIEIMGLQTIFSSLFDYTHNIGTWFISCLLICYILYPFLQETIKQLNLRMKLTVIALCLGILLYAPIIVRIFHTANIYSNPFFRLLEFTIGVTLAALYENLQKNHFINKYILNWRTAIIGMIILGIGISVLVRFNVGIGDPMSYNWITLPMFILILLGFTGCQCEIMKKNKCFHFLRQMTYTFFLAQLYSNWLCKIIITSYDISSNIIKIVLGWSTCIMIALMLRLVEVNVMRLIKR